MRSNNSHKPSAPIHRSIEVDASPAGRVGEVAVRTAMARRELNRFARDVDAFVQEAGMRIILRRIREDRAFA